MTNITSTYCEVPPAAFGAAVDIAVYSLPVVLQTISQNCLGRNICCIQQPTHNTDFDVRIMSVVMSLGALTASIFSNTVNPFGIPGIAAGATLSFMGGLLLACVKNHRPNALLGTD